MSGVLFSKKSPFGQFSRLGHAKWAVTIAKYKVMYDKRIYFFLFQLKISFMFAFLTCLTFKF